MYMDLQRLIDVTEKLAVSVEKSNKRFFIIIITIIVAITLTTIFFFKFYFSYSYEQSQSVKNGEYSQNIKTGVK